MSERIQEGGKMGDLAQEHRSAGALRVQYDNRFIPRSAAAPMSSFADWLQRLLTHGEAVLPGPPPRGPAEDTAAQPVLARAFAEHALDVAGLPIAFDPIAALASARLLADACWLLLS